MEKIDLSALTFWQRLKEESPVWAKTVFNWCLSLAGTAAALVAAKATGAFDHIQIPAFVWTACNYAIAAGVAAATVAKTTVDSDKLLAKVQVAQDAQTAVGGANVQAPSKAVDPGDTSTEVKVDVPVSKTGGAASPPAEQ